MSNSNNLLPLEPDKYYHIFNHANGKENPEGEEMPSTML